MVVGAKMSVMATGVSNYGLNLSKIESQISIIGSTDSINTVGLNQP